MNRDLFLAILSMDSYNRGYGRGIKFSVGESAAPRNESGVQIGNATVLAQSNVSDGSDAVTAGFYALAYDLSTAGIAGLTGTVISYRGSDNINGGLAFANFLLRLNTAGILFVPSYGVTVELQRQCTKLSLSYGVPAPTIFFLLSICALHAVKRALNLHFISLLRRSEIFIKG